MRVKRRRSWSCGLGTSWEGQVCVCPAESPSPRVCRALLWQGTAVLHGPAAWALPAPREGEGPSGEPSGGRMACCKQKQTCSERWCCISAARGVGLLCSIWGVGLMWRGSWLAVLGRPGFQAASYARSGMEVDVTVTITLFCFPGVHKSRTAGDDADAGSPAGNDHLHLPGVSFLRAHPCRNAACRAALAGAAVPAEPDPAPWFALRV